MFVRFREDRGFGLMGISIFGGGAEVSLFLLILFAVVVGGVWMDVVVLGLFLYLGFLFVFMVFWEWKCVDCF